MSEYTEADRRFDAMVDKDKTQQLITELEKPRKNYPQGVLTWEVGDETTQGWLFLKQLDVRHCRVQNQRGIIFDTTINKLTHSADDPRLLGRVLRELSKAELFYLVQGEDGDYWALEDEYDVDIDANGYDTLLNAALQMWLAKVEEGVNKNE